MKKLSVKLVMLLLRTVLLVGMIGAICFVLIDKDAKNTSSSLIPTFFAILVLAFFAFSVNHLVISRIKTVSVATQKISQGDFSVRLRDMSDDEISALADDFNKMASALQANEYLSRDFTKNISHELKTPIATIKGYSDLILKSENVAEMQEYARIILAESERLNKLSQNMLQLSLIESSELIKKADTFLLDEQIRTVILTMQTMWEQKNIDFDLNLEDLRITSNEQLLYIVWQNLLSNAIKFSSEGGKITVNLYRQQDYIVVEVRDYGIGMTEDQRRRLFEQFYIADKSRNRSGSGLGMPIVKKILNKLDGEIAVVSAEGEGTAVGVRLKMQEQQASQTIKT